MDWQCAKCGIPLTLVDEESISDATRRHSSEAVHAWTGARRALPNGTEQRWLTPSERADRSERARIALLRPGYRSKLPDLDTSEQSRMKRGLPADQGRGETVKKVNGGAVWGFAALVVGFAMVIGVAIDSDEEPGSSPSGLPTAVYSESDVSSAESYAPSSPESEESPPTPAIPFDSPATAYAPEPGKGLKTTRGWHRDARDNDGYYDGNYGNDGEWHRKHGNADEYYDGNYDNDDDYHRKYGRN
ncbi:hypothetical protein OG627_18175 [Streptomyces sp. NBC_01429]|nr:hypothetical protein [Streptomyces sp. NBC_01429]